MKKKTLFLIITIFCLTILFSFYTGIQTGMKIKPLKTPSLIIEQPQISTPEAYNSFMQWKLLDCQRRNDAFQEIIEMEMEEKK